jgi:hypothetical protein
MATHCAQKFGWIGRGKGAIPLKPVGQVLFEPSLERPAQGLCARRWQATPCASRNGPA